MITDFAVDQQNDTGFYFNQLVAKSKAGNTDDSVLFDEEATQMTLCVLVEKKISDITPSSFKADPYFFTFGLI